MDSYEETVQDKLSGCMDWLIENEERMDKISTPWKVSEGKWVSIGNLSNVFR